MEFAAYEKARQISPMTYLFTHRAFAEKVLGFKPGERGVVCNGKVSVPELFKHKCIPDPIFS
jgi:hypothetical protein